MFYWCLPDFSDASLVADGGKNTYNTIDRDTEAEHQAALQHQQKQGKPVYGFNLPSVSTKLTHNRALPTNTYYRTYLHCGVC